MVLVLCGLKSLYSPVFVRCSLCDCFILRLRMFVFASACEHIFVCLFIYLFIFLFFSASVSACIRVCIGVGREKAKLIKKTMGAGVGALREETGYISRRE